MTLHDAPQTLFDYIWSFTANIITSTSYVNSGQTDHVKSSDIHFIRL